MIELVYIPDEQCEMLKNISNLISADATQILRDGIPLPKEKADRLLHELLDEGLIDEEHKEWFESEK